MAYAECESALKALLVTMTSQFANSYQITSADSVVLDKGVASAAILWPGGIGPGRNGQGPSYERAWAVHVELFIPFTEEATSFAAFVALRDAVVRKIDQNPNLSGAAGVNDAVIVSESEIVYVEKEGGISTGPVFLMQRFSVSIYQSLTVT